MARVQRSPLLQRPVVERGARGGGGWGAAAAALGVVRSRVEHTVDRTTGGRRWRRSPWPGASATARSGFHPGAGLSWRL